MKLSIITVNLNNREGLKKTLDSVAAQTWRDFEHIIIDGASTDGSVDVIREYAQGSEPWTISQDPSAANTSTPVAQPQTHQDISHPYTIKWISEKDTGIYNAMNKGIRMAQGEYCFFLNSGDYLVDNEVFARVSLDSFSDDVVFGNIVLDYGSYRESTVSPGPITLYTFIFATISHSGCSFIRRESFDFWGLYDENLKIVSDWKWFLLSVGLGSASVKHVDVILSIFDCYGIGFKELATAKQEREKVLEEVVPSRILDDYYNFYSDVVRLRNIETSLRTSWSYLIGNCILHPRFNNIKKLFCSKKRLFE